MDIFAQMKHFIVIDGGTQNVKAFVFDLNGNVISKSVFPVAPYFSVAPYFAEQDAEKYLAIVKKTVREAVKNSKLSFEDISAISITTHRSTIIPVDEKGKPVRAAITWLDERKTEGLRLPYGASRLLVKLVGKEYMMKEYQRRSKFNWMKKYEPENYERTYKFLTASSYIFSALTGEFKDSSAMIVGIFPIDLKHLTWYDFPFVYKALGVSKEKLPTLVSPVDIAGYVSKKGAEEFGLKEGLPVIIAAGDKQSELLAGGGINSKIAEVSYGTAAVIEILTDRFVSHPHMDFFTWGSAIPEKWVLEGLVGGGYWMVSWFEREFARHELIEAKKLGISPETLLDREMSEIPPGSEGLVLQPYWFPFAFDPASRGAIIGFSAKHTRVHVYRAIIEGIAFELKRVLEVIRDYSGFYPEILTVGGGGSESCEIMQITSDIFNLPARRMHTPYLSALGAAIDAAVAMNIYSGFSEALEKMSRVKDTFYPQKKAVKIYDALFRDVYKNIYPALRKLYHKTDKIVNG